jgi:HlyD family secretion protein
VLTEQLEKLTGSYLREGEPILEIADAGQWRAVFMVAERDVYKIRVGDSVKIEVPALAALEADLLRGSVISVASEPVTPSGGSSGGAPGGYRVVATLDRAQMVELGLDRFKRGYTVRGKVITRRGHVAALLRDYFREQLARGR